MTQNSFERTSHKNPTQKMNEMMDAFVLKFKAISNTNYYRLFDINIQNLMNLPSIAED